MFSSPSSVVLRHSRYLYNPAIHSSTGYVFGRHVTCNRYNHITVRAFYNLSNNWFNKEYQYTKYRISKPNRNNNTSYDDIYLADPKRSDFSKITKECSLFLRFLKLVCDLENRQPIFVQYAKRCEDGLLVEKDVYINKEELISCIWKNGYSDAEINAFNIAFNNDYRFHYPELAVLFEISEEDAYKYCIKTRAANPEELVELNYKKPTNFVMHPMPLNLSMKKLCGNAWFYSKTLPFGAVFYMLASYFSRDIASYMNKHAKESAEVSLVEKEKAEQIVYDQMQKYANDARCLEFISSFKVDVQKQLAKYHLALVRHQEEMLTERMLQKLVAIQQAEKHIQESVHEIIVSEVISSFRQAFAASPALENAAFDAAVKNLAIPPPKEGEIQPRLADPVGDHMINSLRELQKVDFASGKATGNAGSIGDKVIEIFNRKEKEFLDMFTVKKNEAAEVKKLATKCQLTDGGYDFSRLSQAEMAKLEQLFNEINNRVGFEVPHESALKAVKCDDERSKHFSEFINQKLEATATRIRDARLSAFASAFA